MMVVKERNIVGNPYRRPKLSSGRRKRKSNARRRRMTPKQIRHFGTKAQRAALKRKYRAKRTKSNPRPRRKARRMKVVRMRASSAPRRKKAAKRRRSARSRNPVHLLNLGFINPHKGGRKVAKARKRKRKTYRVSSRRRRASNPKRRRRASNRRRRNYTKVVVMRKRRSNRRGRNPFFFGTNASITTIAKYVVGGLAGVAITKTVTPMLPAMLTSSNAVKIISEVAVALAAGWLAGKISSDFGSAVMFGGLMQAGSDLLTSFNIPGGSYLALSGYRGGMGAFVPGSYTVPQVPVLLTGGGGGGGGAVTPSPKSRAYGRAY